ncbi:MAG: aldo/keto reductase [Verrucomicrobia bacterium]|nr:aldo/keto reductase [Verrucomicrobiota bacterium]MBV8483200.1 aldo/keto reductase [Verrucomicrobiota bacterium]
MDFLPLGNSGLEVSRLCLGCMSYGSSKAREWILNEEAALPFYQQAIEAGINFFDTADLYSQGMSEEVTGRALKKLGVRREQVVIATKVFYPTGTSPNERGTSKKHVRHAIDASLRRLGLDYVDLYQIHRYDRSTPMEETLEALTDLIKQGKVLYLGASSMAAWEFAKFVSVAKANGFPRFISMQNHYNLVYREEEHEMIPLCREENVGIIPWSPLARGFLAGNRPRSAESETVRGKTDASAQRLYHQESDYQVIDRVIDMAKKRGLSNAQIALAWMLHKPGITSPIIGATKPHHLEEAVKALEVQLTQDDIEYLEEPYQPHQVLGI